MATASIRRLLVAATAALAWSVPLVAAADGGIVPLSPHPQEHVRSTTPTIAARVSGASSLAQGSIHVLVDGRDVSDAITIKGDRVEFAPTGPLDGGMHAAEVDVAGSSGSRLSYQWSFTVDGVAANSAAASNDAASANSDPVAHPPVELPATDLQSYPPLNASLGDPGPPYGYPGFGAFYSVNPAPYYWGQNVPFIFSGTPNGYGFVTFGGMPGFFNLIPLGVNTYYVQVPIPVGFATQNPPIVCHFFPGNGNGKGVVVPYQRHISIVAHRSPTLPQTRSALAANESPSRGFSTPYRATHVTGRPTSNPRMSTAPHMNRTAPIMHFARYSPSATPAHFAAMPHAAATPHFAAAPAARSAVVHLR